MVGSMLPDTLQWKYAEVHFSLYMLSPLMVFVAAFSERENIPVLCVV